MEDELYRGKCLEGVSDDTPLGLDQDVPSSSSVIWLFLFVMEGPDRVDYGPTETGRVSGESEPPPRAGTSGNCEC